MSSTGSTTRSYTVSGMTCGHCVAAVTEEVGRVAGVSDVTVDLDSGRLTLAAEPGVDDGAVRAAVEEAGYEVETAGT
jgi:copper chaperone